ncbi:hypothetical protein [Dolosigranulum pigrum]|uniref:hypothetical protein n=1 Tax=Dolosigranulum pigrum TaxID=29394 RepID=UPI001FCAA2E2|nr:hypothetical protein [Dolosigranulum pigrum]
MQRHYSSRQFSQKPIVTYGIIAITLVTFGLQVFLVAVKILNLSLLWEPNLMNLLFIIMSGGA